MASTPDPKIIKTLFQLRCRNNKLAYNYKVRHFNIMIKYKAEGRETVEEHQVSLPEKVTDVFNIVRCPCN